MNWTKVLLFIIISCSISTAQEYFQQDVEYIITAELNDAEHLLSGDMVITYTNNAPQALDEIYIHLWANSFKDNNSYFAADQIRRGLRDFYFAEEEDRGSYTDIRFSINDSDISYEAVDGYDDVIKLSLPSSLASGQSIKIQADFTLKMPVMFSRLGHDNGTYHFTHWYPRVAVYDRKGWHPIHYGIAEFYGEYASYQVALTLPSDYRIEFTGSGVAGLPSTADGKMSWVINADRVHDFAWVASKEYITDYEKVKSIDGRDIELTVLRRPDYRPYWSEAIDLLKESLAYYEKEIGPYAYDKIVLVQDVEDGNLNMEYPGLIIVGDRGDTLSLEYYINHELGHQWFYGALGFNEYQEPWLDEGLTTYYEHRYTMRKYGISHYGQISNKLMTSRQGLEPLHAVILANHRCHCHQRADTPIGDMTTVNYGIRSYEMAATYYNYLDKYLGRELFDKGMRSFYQEWKYKNPSSKDLQKHMEEQSGKDLGWFFEEMLLTDEHIDYKLKDFRIDGSEAKVSVQNKSNYAIPVYLEFTKGNITTGGLWVEPFDGTKEVTLPSSDLDLITLDKENLSFDVNRKDNQLKTEGLLKTMEPVRVSIANSTDPAEESNIFIAALGGFNTTDGLYLGPSFLNATIPTHGFRWELLPYYAFESKSIVGQGRIAYDHFFKNGAIRGMQYSLGYKSFHFSDFQNELEFPDFETNLRYQRLEPRAHMIFRHEPVSGISSGLELKNLRIYRDRLNFDIDDVPPSKDLVFDDIQILSYTRKKKNGLTTNRLLVELEHQAYENIIDSLDTKRYLKLTASMDKKVYFAKKRAFDIRLFGAGFLHNTERESSSVNSSLVHGSIPLFAGGHNDYRFDGKFLNRADQDESQFVKNQVGLHGGGFKNALESGSRLGYSNNFAFAINATTDFPIKLPLFLRPLRIFLDAGYYSTKGSTSQPFRNEFLYSAGLTYDLEFLKIYFPIILSDQIRTSYPSDSGFLNRITFSIDFPRFDYNGLVEFIDM